MTKHAESNHRCSKNKPFAVAGTRQSESILSNGWHEAYSTVQSQLCTTAGLKHTTAESNSAETGRKHSESTLRYDRHKPSRVKTSAVTGTKHAGSVSDTSGTKHAFRISS
jgi:hypothetical protein